LFQHLPVAVDNEYPGGRRSAGEKLPPLAQEDLARLGIKHRDAAVVPDADLNRNQRAIPANSEDRLAALKAVIPTTITLNRS
jgi:hypothetical protein